VIRSLTGKFSAEGLGNKVAGEPETPIAGAVKRVFDTGKGAATEDVAAKIGGGRHSTGDIVAK
jgi:hypothetical protein